MFKGNIIRLGLVLLVGFLAYSCAITRHIPEDKLLLSKVRIEPNDTTPKSELIPATTLERYTRQSPNKRLLGFNFYLWVHYLANPDKSNWWNNLKRSVGEEPVYFDLSLTEKSRDNLNVYMDSQGFYSSTVEFSVDTLAERRRVEVKYKTHQGRPYIIKDLKYQFVDTLLRPIVLSDTTESLIRRGDIFSVALLDNERERITKRLRNQGYFDFSVRNIEYRADTLAGDYTVALEMIIKRDLAGYDSRGNPRYQNNRRYILTDINIFPGYDPAEIVSDPDLLSGLDTLTYRGLNVVYPEGKNPNVRPTVLRQIVPLTKWSLFDASQVELAYQNLMSLGYFKSARINFVPTNVEMTPQDSLLVNSNSMDMDEDEGFLEANILASPALRQSYDIELEGSTTSSFYGAYATIGYQNRNIFRGAEAWNVDFTVGYEHMKAPDAVKTRATEVGISTSLDFPRFILPFVRGRVSRALLPKTSVELSVNFQDRPYYNRNLSSASISYSWRDKKYSTFTVRPIDINVIDMKYIDESYYDLLENDYLRNSYETQLIMGLNFGYYYNNQRKNLSGNYTMFRLNLESSGNLLNAIERVFNSPRNEDGNYEVFGIRYAQYVRGDINVSRKITIGERSAVVGRLYAGAGLAYGNSSAIPFDRLFYSGGSNSMRGWTPRTLGPGSVAEESDSVYPSQLGDMKLEANLEFRFPIWGMLHGATFLDVGNVWYLKDSDGVYDEEAIFSGSNFYRQLGFNTGVGLRLDIQFAILRLDWGVQLHNPNKAEGSRWVIKSWDWSNTALQFGVGYPF